MKTVLDLALALLLGAEPDPAIAVIAPEAGDPVAAAVAQALPSRLAAESVEIDDYLDASGSGCRSDLECLSAAPEVAGAIWLIDVRVRDLGGGRSAADVRVIDRATALLIARSARVVEQGALARWAANTAVRLLAGADPRRGRRPRDGLFPKIGEPGRSEPAAWVPPEGSRLRGPETDRPGERKPAPQWRPPRLPASPDAR